MCRRPRQDTTASITTMMEMTTPMIPTTMPTDIWVPALCILAADRDITPKACGCRDHDALVDATGRC